MKKEEIGYISGQMTGLANMNAEMFNNVVAEMELKGLKVINPIKIGEDLQDISDSLENSELRYIDFFIS